MHKNDGKHLKKAEWVDNINGAKLYFTRKKKFYITIPQAKQLYDFLDNTDIDGSEYPLVDTLISELKAFINDRGLF